MNTSSTELVHHIMEIAVVLADRIVENYQDIREKNPNQSFPGNFVDSLIDASDIQDKFAAWCRQRALEAGAMTATVAVVSTPPSENVSYDELKSNMVQTQGCIMRMGSDPVVLRR